MPILDLLLPVGISFYTFQALSYTMDVYREEIKPEKHFGIYALFVSYFPQLVAGPIERSKHLLPQLRNFSNLRYENLRSGGILALWGFFKKMVIADKISIVVDTVYDNPSIFFGAEVFIALLFFSIQIYCDFSAYTDIARGVARMMGIDIMKNFDSPYFSKSMTEFWRRWHISLSTWFRDYLYIPLGGSRNGEHKTYLNLFIVFVISGLWHGASINFVIWGALHGLLIVLEKFFNKWELNFLGWNKELFSYKLYKGIVTFLLVTIFWVFFRANSFADALIVIRNLLKWDSETFFNGGLYNLGQNKEEFWMGICFILAMLAVEYYNSFKGHIQSWIIEQNIVFRWGLYLFFILIILVFGSYGGEQKEFIYFQF